MRRTWVLLQTAEQSGAPNCLLLPYLLCLPQILKLSLLSPLQNHSDGRTSNELLGCLHLGLTIEKTGKAGAQLSQEDVVRIKPV